MAVLQYHATPWLKSSWRSEDILFNDSEVGQLQPNFCTPYLNTKVREDGNQLSRSSTFATSMARNPLLFTRGVVLLKITHGASLEILRRPAGFENGGERFQEFFTAWRLAKLKDTMMGHRYHAVVEQCLFPFGDDLNNTKLQVAFHQDVIGPLGELEAGYRKFYLADWLFDALEKLCEQWSAHYATMLPVQRNRLDDVCCVMKIHDYRYRWQKRQSQQLRLNHLSDIYFKTPVEVRCALKNLYHKRHACQGRPTVRRYWGKKDTTLSREALS